MLKQFFLIAKQQPMQLVPPPTKWLLASQVFTTCEKADFIFTEWKSSSFDFSTPLVVPKQPVNSLDGFASAEYQTDSNTHWQTNCSASTKLKAKFSQRRVIERGSNYAEMMNAAVFSVVHGGMGLRKAACRYNVPLTSLWAKVKKRKENMKT